MSKRAAFPLDAQRTSPAIARGHTARLLDPLVLAEFSDDAQLVVSELVTNAVIYGTEPITLRLALEGEVLRIEVFDSGPAIGAVEADPRTCRATSPGGRGLQIVEALAVSCGVERHPAGMTVWAVVRIHSAVAGRGAASDVPVLRSHPCDAFAVPVEINAATRVGSRRRSRSAR